MVWRVRVHVDGDGNAVLPCDPSLRGQDVELDVEVVEKSSTAGRDETDPQSIAWQKQLQDYLSSVKQARPPVQPRVLTPEQQAERLKLFDELTGSWSEDFTVPRQDAAGPEREP